MLILFSFWVSSRIYLRCGDREQWEGGILLTCADGFTGPKTTPGMRCRGSTGGAGPPLGKLPAEVGAHGPPPGRAVAAPS